MNGLSLWSRLMSQFRKWRSPTMTVPQTPDVPSPVFTSRSRSSLSSFYPFGHHSAFNIEYRPKSLPDYDYSAILCGGVGPENYSQDCWLEEHLHRFSSLSGDRTNMTDGMEESPDTSGVDENVPDFSVDSFINSDANSLQWIYLYQYGLTDDTPGVESPPPYWDGPPPSYEEATRSRGVEREFSWCSLTQVDHASDWMW
ncbi:uncharacterized protein LOC121388410 [Gigantopelta aegis]|uniref:uncharacterized protein LOC121388410 n=1 Tax=Gigantopelta aegis TaxID=1735272 RepID=UPI001B88A6A9|nr:uncharacterized protein LOC121388410 [Gigantopelta aegis]